MGYSEHELSTINMLYSIKRGNYTPTCSERPPLSGVFFFTVFSKINSGERSSKPEVETVAECKKVISYLKIKSFRFL